MGLPTSFDDKSMKQLSETGEIPMKDKEIEAAKVSKMDVGAEEVGDGIVESVVNLVLSGIIDNIIERNILTHNESADIHEEDKMSANNEDREMNTSVENHDKENTRDLFLPKASAKLHAFGRTGSFDVLDMATDSVCGSEPAVEPANLGKEVSESTIENNSDEAVFITFTEAVVVVETLPVPKVKPVTAKPTVPKAELGDDEKKLLIAKAHSEASAIAPDGISKHELIDAVAKLDELFSMASSTMPLSATEESIIPSPSVSCSDQSTSEPALITQTFFQTTEPQSASPSIADELWTSLVTPGYNSAATGVMRFCFFALFTVLLLLFFITEFNLHVGALFLITGALYASVEWFV